MKTYSVKAKEIVPQWHVVDAADQPLGRLATRVASLLRGKHRVDFTPHLDMRDFVIVVNAAKVRATGKNKLQQKTYYRHTMYPGGFRTTTLDKMLAAHPERVIEHAVRGMLPHNRLGAALRRHLKVYAGPEHPHAAQISARPKTRAAAPAPSTAPAAAPAKAAKRAPKARAEKPAKKAAAVKKAPAPKVEAGQSEEPQTSEES